MSRFRQYTNREVPELNLAALPDLIFTVLFFFMIVTHMRQVEPKVSYQVPQGTEVNKEVSKAGLVYILIGESLTTVPSANSEGRNTTADGEHKVQRIQLNDQLVELDESPLYINKVREEMSEDDRQRMTVCLRADRDTEMGIINDVKQQLRRAGVLKVIYSATKKQKTKEQK